MLAAGAVRLTGIPPACDMNVATTSSRTRVYRRPPTSTAGALISSAVSAASCARRSTSFRFSQRLRSKEP